MIYKELHSSCFTEGLALQLLTHLKWVAELN